MTNGKRRHWLISCQPVFAVVLPAIFNGVLRRMVSAWLKQAGRSNGVGHYDAPRPTLYARLSLPNTSYISNTFDSVSRLTGTYLTTSGGVVTNQHQYVYNLAGLRTNETRMDASTVAYNYDQIGQLTVADSSVNAEDRGYYYDAAWNLNRRTNNGVTGTFSVNVLNGLTNAPSPVNAQTYDANGNLATARNGKVLFLYDEENRLERWASYQNSPTQVTVGDKVTDFVYDGLGRLRRRLEYRYDSPPETPGEPEAPQGSGWVLVSETRYIYDGKRVIQERDGNNTPTVSYTRGTDLSGSLEGAGGIGGLLGRSHGYSGGNWSTHTVYHADGNGNVTFLLNGSQSMVARYRYDPFGNTITQSGGLADANVYRFSSKECHTNSGMYYYLYRFYDPNLQRWVNRDPLGEAGFETVRGIGFDLGGADPTLYQFVLNDPINRVDSFGLSSLHITLMQAIAAGDTATIESCLAAGEGVLSDAAMAAGRAALQKFRSTATQWIGQKCKGSIMGRFPSQFLNQTLEQIKNAAQAGDKAAKTAWKLLNDSRFWK